MTETPPPDELLLTTAAIPYWIIALAVLIAMVIFAIFNVQAGQPTSNPSDIQKRFGLITWTRRAAHFIIGLWGCALALLMGAFFLTAFQLLQEILATSNQDVIQQLSLALPAVAAASAGLIALPITLNRLQLTNRQTQAEEEGLITDRINAAVLGLGAEKIVKVTEDGQVIERTEPNVEVRIGAILALERIARKNLNEHVLVMEILCAFIRQNCERKLDPLDLRDLDFGPSYLDPFSIPPIVINTVLNVIGRRNEKQIETELHEKFTLDLTDCHLVGFHFLNANFQNISFSGSILWHLYFGNCNFRGTIFQLMNEASLEFDNCKM